MVITASLRSDQWFWRVWIWCLIDVDIPRLSSDGIQFGACFRYTYSLQSSSTHSPISLSFDAAALESAIRSNSNYIKSPCPVSSLPNESPRCSWTTKHSVNQPPTPSPFQTNRDPLIPFPVRPQVRWGVCEEWNPVVWRVESHNLWVSFSQNASGSLINIVH